MKKSLTIDHHIKQLTKTEVEVYLLQYPEMRRVTAEVVNRAKSYFSKDTKLSLEVYRDPEFSDPHLKLYVRQDTYQKNILEQIEHFSKSCDDILENTSGWLHITTDFS